MDQQSSSQLQLAKYLKEFISLRTKVIRKHDEYESVLWFDELPNTTDCICPLIGKDSDPDQPILEVHKQQYKDKPAPPESVHDWIDLARLDDPADELPSLDSRILVPVESKDGSEYLEELLLEDHPQVVADYEEYRSPWVMWAKERQQQEDVQKVYAKLFSLYNRMLKENEILEVVLSFGLLQWHEEGFLPVNRHTFVANVDLKFVPGKGVIRVIPSENGAFRVEDDMLEANQRPENTAYVEINEICGHIGENLNDGIKVSEAIKRWGNHIHSNMHWDDSFTPPRNIQEGEPVIVMAPALVLRKRNLMCMKQIYENMETALSESDENTSECWRALSSYEDVFMKDNPDERSGGLIHPHQDEVYFPLPANKEQRRIIQAISRQKGVLVQGPPGTGKSHTIANLMSHLLATGQKILVTAKTSRALGVLKDKLPDSIKPLCVSLLGQNSDYYSELNRAVQGITSRQSAYSNDTCREQVEEFEEELDRVRRELASVRSELKSIRSSEVEKNTLADGAYKGTLSGIARQVSEDRDQYSWLRLPKSAGDSPPVQADELLQLLDLKKKIAGAKDLQESRDTGAQEHESYKVVKSLSSDSLERLKLLLDEIEKDSNEISRRDVSWPQSAINDLLKGNSAKWRTIRDKSQRVLAKIKLALDRLDGLDGCDVEIPSDRDTKLMRSDAGTVCGHLAGGGKWKRLGFLHRKLKGKDYFLTEVRVNSEPADDARKMGLICDYLDIVNGSGVLNDLWEEVGGVFPSRNLKIKVTELSDAEQYLDECFALNENCRKLSGLLYAGTTRGTDVFWFTSRLPNIRKTISETETANQLDQLCKKVSNVLPGLPEAIAKSLDDEQWPLRLQDIDLAWSWCKADQELSTRGDYSHQVELIESEKRLVNKELGLLEKIASLKAWIHFFDRITPKESQSLKGWLAAVQSLGKGKGKSNKVYRIRQEARKYLEECRSAIPVWIMPTYLIAEMVVKVTPGMFDVVIIDEASQLGIDSLFLFYIARKIVVVGDDQQISPSGIGIKDDDVHSLQRRFAKDLPHKAALYPQSSLYSNAKIRFNSNIVLREHFRCMPEIIQFSNDLCYAPNGTPLDPIKSFPPDRLDPVRVHHVVEGYRKGTYSHSENPPEARAIVDQIKECIKDPRYTGKTIGVISLLGDWQSKRVEDLLSQEVDPVEIQKRRLICGNPYTFQGDERDIIFLSMVAAAAGPVRLKAITGESDRQRFNVAVSRARDQLWLYHSATLEDLSDQCLRYRLLKYMRNPVRDSVTSADPIFESDFEKKVYNAISSRGFRVQTQVAVGDKETQHYRIDLVVEGIKGRLAVECDGDRWHGPDRYDADMARQRDLERAGWEFFRISGSDFYRNQITSLEPLWKRLEELDIHPGIEEVSETAPIQAPEMDEKDPVEIPVDDTEAELVDPKTLVKEENESTGPYPVCMPYLEYTGDGGPYPTTTNEHLVMNGICRIVDIEGPMLAERAYRIYMSCCGKDSITGEEKRLMNRALKRALDRGLIHRFDEHQSRKLALNIVRSKRSSPVVLRRRGSRTFDEIPPSEIKLAAKQLLEAGVSRDDLASEITCLFDLADKANELGTLVEDYCEPVIFSV